MTITVTIGLKLSNWDQFTTQLFDISNPDSTNYGNHLTAEQLFALIDPPKAVIDLTLQWIKTVFGIEASHSHGYITFAVTVRLLNTVLGTEYHTFKSLNGKDVICTLSLSIPSALIDNFELFTPGTSFDTGIAFEPVESTQAATAQATSDPCDNAMNPGCLQRLYGIPMTRATQLNNVLAVPGFLQQYANRNDLAMFLSFFRPDVQPNFKDESIDGGINPQFPNSGGLEADLDIQYTVGVASGVPVTFLSVGLSNINGFIDMAFHWLSQPIPPTVVSVSYGFNENQFVPTFPASCPYITAVGATKDMAESGAGFSAGGFSNYFARPSYQQEQVSAYLNKIGTQYQGRFNRGGRAYPDVAAIGNNVVIAYHGHGVRVYGTSASAPIFASIVALINDRRIAKSRGVLGFLNPLIYSRPHIWKDITTGNNPSCNTPGFPARRGWDPVTGMGSPLFRKFAGAVGV
ncbi:hypothetical protein BGZ81_000837 [Podila clonocystis]|nr:hypothetical protein BGZ81_000837 [Podila clonocystis]